MAQEAKTQEKKTTSAKSSSPQKKSASKKRLNKGQEMLCEACGLLVTVEDIGGIEIETEEVLYCCGEPMQEKSSSRKSSKKQTS